MNSKETKPQSESKVAIVYFSGGGHTASLADAIKRGAESVPGVTAQLIPIQGDDIQGGRFRNDAILERLDGSDAIVFGSPTYMGGPAAQFKAFADSTSGRWYERRWVNKLAAGFTVSAGPSGDKFSTLNYFITFAMQHGMLWTGLNELPTADGVNRLSGYSGAIAQAGQEDASVAPNAADRLTGESLGRRVAESARRWSAAQN